MGVVKYDDDYWRDFIHEVHGGKSVREVCVARGIARQTFYNRLRQAPELRALLDGALEDNADRWAERADEIIQELRDGKTTHQVARVSVEHFHWRAERANPARYGAKGQVEHKGAGTSFIDALKEAEAKRRAPALESQPAATLVQPAGEQVYVPREESDR